MYLLKKKRQTENPEKQAGRDRNFLYFTLSPRKIQSPHISLKTAHLKQAFPSKTYRDE
jgi:hypothetical protein